MRIRLVLLSLLAALACGLAPRAGAATQFLRRPDVHGDQLLFTSEGDLWLGSVAAGTAARITSHEGVESPAFFSPDGRWIAFSAQYDGGTDVYVMETAGGLPKRLTYSPAGATVTGWSPDGRQVIYRARQVYPRRNRLFAVPAAGGPSRALPIPYGEFASLQADGHRIAYVPVSAEWQHWKHYKGGEADDIWLADTSARSFKRLTTDPGVDTEPVWVGEALYFVSERDGHANLWKLDVASGALNEATHYADYDVRYPSSDGRHVVFEHGDGIALYDPASGEAHDLALALHSDRIHARPRRVPALPNLGEAALGPTGKRLLVAARGQILSAPAENGDVRVIAAPAGARCQYPAWSPDGQRCAFVSDASGEEQVWIAPATGGPAKQLSRDHVGPLGPLTWSPDGKWLATSDREMRILLVDAASGAFTTVDQADRGGSYDIVLDSYRFSPDSRWLAYARTDPNWNGVIWLYELASRRHVQVSSNEMNCDRPAFDADGKFLYFLADRAFDPRSTNAERFFSFDKFTKVTMVPLAADTPSPFLEKNDEEKPAGTKDEKPDDADKKAKDAKAGAAKAAVLTRIDPANLAERVSDVPVPADHYEAVVPVGGRLLMLVRADGEDADHELRAFDLKKKEVSVVVKKLTSFEVSADGKKMLLQSGKDLTIADADAETVADGKGKVSTAAWILTIDPAAEWRQILGETWRIARDFFYDPKMHGADWPAVRKRYEAELPAVADRSDLAFLQGEIVAELNAGHAYIRVPEEPRGSQASMGFLGADFEPVASATPAWRITKLYAGDGFDLESRSPLLAPGLDVKPGDYLLAVGGRPVHADEDVQALLVGTADQVTSLTVNRKPSLEGAREIRVKPLANERAARYYDWVASRIAYVHEHGGANLAYLHVPSMSEPGLVEWGKHYYPQLGKDGMIIDVRFNGGGYIDAMLLLQLSTKPYSWFKPRYGASWTRQDWGFGGYAAALCNEESGSDAEEFCDAFQRLKLGPVIGVHTWGGEVGSGGGYPLLDGGLVYIPNYGEWVPGNQWVIEGHGVEPDMTVADDPTAAMAGRDPQLDRAIAAIEAKLHSEPLVRPTPPPFPVKTVGSR